MRAKVIKRFIDKMTNKPREIGAEFDCSENRFSELVGFVEAVNITKTKPKSKNLK